MKSEHLTTKQLPALLGCWLVYSLFALTNSSWAGETSPEPPDGLTSAERGYWLLVNKPYLPQDFDQRTVDEIWRVWPQADRDAAKQADAEQRRKMTWNRYGITQRPEDESVLPLQYVVNDRGGWVMNCFACHGGQVAGRTIPGAPNSRFAMQTLTEESRLVKPLLGQSFAAKDVAAMLFPLGGTVGTTNAVTFGIVVENYRDANMNVVSFRPPPKMVHHDMDAPAWWHYRKKRFLYIDGFVEKDHRALIPFVLSKENDGPTVRGWEDEFRDIEAYLESLEAPAYPFAIDDQLAEAGRAVFDANCARCHGTYGNDETYDPPVVPLAEIGTDPVRLDALSQDHRRNYQHSWLSHYGDRKVLVDPKGYVPPPLDGIWASGPYLHNGSVPTLRHMLYPEERPAIWRRVDDRLDDYDTERVGLKVQTYEQIPKNLPRSEQRTYFQTSKFGKSAAGHDYPALLTDAERKALLEYLKTL